MNRRDLLALGSGLPYFLQPSSAFAVTDWDPWKDLLNALPSKVELDVPRKTRGSDIVDYSIQKIEDAKSVKVNFDFYAVDVEKLPTGLTAQKLLEHCRKNLNYFFDQQYSQFVAYSTIDEKSWTQTATAPVGSIMQFNIPFAGLQEQGAVVTSNSSNLNWVFTPIKIGIANPGEHPVAGNREFGLLAKAGLATRVYTRGADRALSGVLDPSEDIVYAGADNLWKSFQKTLGRLHQQQWWKSCRRIAGYQTTNMARRESIGPVYPVDLTLGCTRTVIT